MDRLLDTQPITQGLQLLVLERGEQMLDEALERHRNAGQVATGQTSRSLRIIEKPDGFQLWGWKYAGSYDEGRKPGKMPPVDAIMAWIEAKGLTFTEPGQARHYAWAIARKIAQKGTQRYSNNADVWATPIKQMRKDISAMSTKYLAETIMRQLLRTDIAKK